MRVAIVGTAPLSRGLAPFTDPAWEIWACSPGNMGLLPRVSLWFEIHSIETMKLPVHWTAWGQKYFEWLQAQNFPVVMQEINELLPRAVVYPMKEMVGKFGHNWFSSSVAWMLALAIERGATEIAIFGVDMAADQEHYTAQKAGCIYFIEAAQKRGIKVHIPHESCLGVAAPLYGYWQATHFGRRIEATRDMVAAKRAEMAAQFEQLKVNIAFFDGALEQIKYFEKTWTDGADADLNLGPIEAMALATPSIDAAPAPIEGITEGPPAIVSASTPPVRLVRTDDEEMISLGRSLGSAGGG